MCFSIAEVWSFELGSDVRPVAMCWDGEGMYVSVAYAVFVYP